MSKKISSIVVIFFTMLYVAVILYLNGYNIVEMGSIKARQVLNSIKHVNIGIDVRPSKNLEANYEEVKQVSEVNLKKNNETVEKIYKPNIIKLTKEARKLKQDRMYQAERELLKSIFDKTPIDENYVIKKNLNDDKDKKNNDNESMDNITSISGNLESSDGAPVFNTEVKYELTDSDKERILTAAKKLSPIDYEKINTYMKYINDTNAKSAINLLRDRLSDKDFEKIKDISIRLNKR